MLSGRCILRAAVMANCLVVAGCENPPDSSSPVEKPVARSVSEQPDTYRSEADNKSTRDEPEVIAREPEIRRPLDLSMPPQPKVELGSLEGKRSSTQRLLPDLFEHEEMPDERALHLKGRVFMQQTGRENIDSIEGGQIILEMRTR